MAAALAAGATVVCSTSGTAWADPEPKADRAIEVGFRTGYVPLPLGDVVGGANGNPSLSLGDEISGVLPLWFEAGYRFNHNMMIGGFLQYGIAFVNTGKQTECTMGSNSCGANDVMFGAQFHYHIIPDGPIDPWVGAGIGYESLNYSYTILGQNVSGSYSGFQFLNLQGGADYKVMANLGVGPFLMLSFGEFGNCSSNQGSCPLPATALHEWLTIGVRGVYDISLL
jgi:hypothetical protein